METINIMVIGVGPHSQRIYLPTLFKNTSDWGVHVSGAVDLHSQQNQIDSYLAQKGYILPMQYIDPFSPVDGLPASLDASLTRFVQTNDIEGVIIATEPMVHRVYAEWALRNGLHILMDKPITTRRDVVSDLSQAKGLYDDYIALRREYDTLQQRKSTIFSVNVQRRYHPCHQKVMKLIREVAERFDAPVTHLQSTHADGQWRMPNEIVDQVYHPYCQGYGKCSHSGYHLFDIFHQYYRAGWREHKYADSIDVISAMVQPRGFLTQFHAKNYRDYFGKNYDDVNTRDDASLSELYENYGEMDATVLVRFLKDGINISNGTINLLHNSFARRTWVRPGDDLYKGNGRVKHESHVIQQGPFQCIQVHSYQSKSNHNVNTAEDILIGGNNHFDIHVFRNAGMFGGHTKPLEIIRLSDIDSSESYDINGLSHEQSKTVVVQEFVDFIHGRRFHSDLLSNIDSHEASVNLMHAVYASHIQQTQGASPAIHLELSA